ncbi:MAG: 4'-phosphopantetheinyl transferase superfamily protein [Clostridia bacterium]|nr:4'-phosphopantetheinyl transferase superfamily protein [Clostridia bacterium]
MLEYYFTDGEVYAALDTILKQRLGSYKILRTQNGKPYLEGDPLFFSVSHSSNKGAVVISDKPVGIDIEYKKDRNYRVIAKRFSELERSEINCLDDFLKHWVIRESYIKMKGFTLADKLFKCEYSDGVFYDCGKAVDCEFLSGEHDGLFWCICIDNK